jgi:hypothetical protein
MANSLTHIAPFCIKKCLFTLEVAFATSAGVPTDPTTPDTEISSDGGATFADCTNEITTGGTNGAGYLTLTSAETDNNVLWIAAKSANCTTTLIPIYPRVLASVGTGTLSAGSAGGGTVGTLLAYDVTGCFIKTTGGTGGAAGALQVRKIVTYSTITGAFTVAPNWETTPDATTTYDVLLPEGVTLGMLRTLNPTTPGRTAVVDANGLIDATTVKIGPTGAASAQTARDIAADVVVIDGIVDTIKLNTDYPDDCVYLDPTNGASGTTVGTNGTIGNPSDTLANANTIATSRGKKRIKFVPRADLTLLSGAYTIELDLNGGSMTMNQTASFGGSSRIYSFASIHGTVTPDIGAGQTQVDLDTNTFWDNIRFPLGCRATDYCYLTRCIIGNTNSASTFTIVGDNSVDPVYLQSCYTMKLSGLTFDCAGGADLEMHDWWGDFTVSNLAAGTTVQCYGYAKVTIDSSCTGGTFRHDSHVEVTNNSTGGATTVDLVSDATTVLTSGGIADAVWDEPQSGHTTPGTFGKYLDDEISGGGSGSGARTVVITIDDGTDPLQNATVRLTEGVNTYTATTDVDGEATFNVDDATYVVAVTKAGYSYAGTSLVVNGDEAATYSMTAIVVTPPADPALCAVTIHLRDQYGTDLADEPVEITFVAWGAAAETPPVLSVPPVQETDDDGLVEVNLYRLATYKIIYGGSGYARRVDVDVPDAGSYTVEL